MLSARFQRKKSAAVSSWFWQPWKPRLTLSPQETSCPDFVQILVRIQLELFSKFLLPLVFCSSPQHGTKSRYSHCAQGCRTGHRPWPLSYFGGRCWYLHGFTGMLVFLYTWEVPTKSKQKIQTCYSIMHNIVSLSTIEGWWATPKTSALTLFRKYWRTRSCSERECNFLL